MATRKTYVVLVNWNGWADTLACVDSLDRLTYPDATVLVVDNGSTDDSIARISAARPELRLIETGANMGFAGGNNVAIRAAMDEGADYVWLLNNDTVVEPDALTALVDALEADPKAGAAGSKITYFDRPDVLWYAGGDFTPEGPVRHRGIDEPDTGAYDTLEETAFITGCSLLLRASVLEQVGLLRDEYFLYWEETDLDWRIRAAGHTLLYVPGSVVRHKVAASLGEGWGPAQTEYLARNMLHFYKLNRPDDLPRVLRHLRWVGAKHVLRGRWELARATFSGIRLFGRGRFGPIERRA
jgi:GT2 family glycosyltransferase